VIVLDLSDANLHAMHLNGADRSPNYCTPPSNLFYLFLPHICPKEVMNSLWAFNTESDYRLA
jgi:hypothetical protein